MKKPGLKTIIRAAKAATYGDGDYAGWCVKCWKKAYGVDPDARKCTCENCGADKVYGAEELVLMMT